MPRATKPKPAARGRSRYAYWRMGARRACRRRGASLKARRADTKRRGAACDSEGGAFCAATEGVATPAFSAGSASSAAEAEYDQPAIATSAARARPVWRIRLWITGQPLKQPLPSSPSLAKCGGQVIRENRDMDAAAATKGRQLPVGVGTEMNERTRPSVAARSDKKRAPVGALSVLIRIGGVGSEADAGHR